MCTMLQTELDAPRATEDDRAVKWHALSRCFCTGTGRARVRLRGVHPTQRAMFHPGYTFKSACFGPRVKVDARRSVKGRDTTLMGREQGSAVDREVTAIARLLAKHRVSVAAFLGKQQLPRSITRSARDALSGYRETQHVYTKKVFAELERQGWEPIAAQVACGSVDARLGTAVDLVCVDPKRPHQDILLELKCGFARYVDRYAGRMHEPFKAMTDSPRNQFQLQLMFSRILYARTFKGRKVGTCAVIRVHETGVSIDMLRRNVIELGAAAWKLLVASSSLRSGVALAAKDTAVVVAEHKAVVAVKKRKQAVGAAARAKRKCRDRETELKRDVPVIRPCTFSAPAHLVHRRRVRGGPVASPMPARVFNGFVLANRGPTGGLPGRE